MVNPGPRAGTSPAGSVPSGSPVEAGSAEAGSVPGEVGVSPGPGVDCFATVVGFACGPSPPPDEPSGHSRTPATARITAATAAPARIGTTTDLARPSSPGGSGAADGGYCAVVPGTGPGGGCGVAAYGVAAYGGTGCAGCAAGTEPAPAPAGEIGRASCRERGQCMMVVVVVKNIEISTALSRVWR